MINTPRRLLLSALCALPLISAAQGSYPNQPIKVIVPFPPGGGSDIVARLLTDKMRVATNWTFVIDNKAGAGGQIGMTAVAKSKPDGYTIGIGQTASIAISPALYPKMPYDAAKEFVPIAMIAQQPVVLVVRAESPYKTLAELVAAAKASPDKLTMASPGNGTVGHMTGVLFNRQAGMQTVHVPYKGASPAATDLLGGQVDYYFATPQNIAPFVKAGKLRALAVSSRQRIPMLPDTPTIAESGYKGFDTSDWKMLVAPAGTPADIVKRIHAEVEKALAKPDTIAQLLAEGSVPMNGTPQQAMQFLKAEQTRWRTLVREANVQPE